MHAAGTWSIDEITSVGPIDPGVARRARSPRGNDAEHDVGAEAVAHALLRLVADLPGQMGRLRAARIIGGYPVPHRDEQDATRLDRYAIRIDWPLRETTRLVDALISGGLVAQTVGPRPVLVLTRAGFHALEALEGVPSAGRGVDRAHVP